jgi:hypothetical protein
LLLDLLVETVKLAVKDRRLGSALLNTNSTFKDILWWELHRFGRSQQGPFIGYLLHRLHSSTIPNGDEEAIYSYV